MIARVNTTVSRPSRPTAWKASSATPVRAPRSSAASVRARSSPDSPRAWLRIQNVMYVSTAAASRNVHVSKIACGREPLYEVTV